MRRSACERGAAGTHAVLWGVQQAAVTRAGCGVQLSVQRDPVVGGLGGQWSGRGGAGDVGGWGSNAEIARRMVPPGDKNAVQRIRKRLGLPPRARAPVAPKPAPDPRAQRSPTGPTLSPAGLSPTRQTPVPTTLPPVLARSYVHPKLGAWTFGCPCCARAILGPMVVAA